MSSVNIVSDITEIGGGAVKLSLTAIGTDMPSEVFAIEVLPKSRDPKKVDYRFSHVCSVSELVEFPAEEDPESSYFRTDEIEMVFDVISLALKVRDSILEDVNKLVAVYNQLQTVSVQGSTTTLTGE